MSLRETMEEAKGPIYSQEMLQEPARGDGHVETGGEPALHCNCRKHNGKKRIIVLGVSLTLVSSALLVVTTVLAAPHGNGRKRNCKKRIMALAVALALVSPALLVAVIVLAVQRCEHLSADLGPPAGPTCPDGWIGYRGKCYYFSEGEGGWASSQKHCSALGASLAGIDTGQDMDFMARHKGKFDHWISLRRDPGQPWKWANGTKFNHSFLIGGGGDCAHLNDQDWVSSSLCTSERYWICTKPDVFTKAKEPAAAGGS